MQAARTRLIAVKSYVSLRRTWNVVVEENICAIVPWRAPEIPDIVRNRGLDRADDLIRGSGVAALALERSSSLKLPRVAFICPEDCELKWAEEFISHRTSKFQQLARTKHSTCFMQPAR